MHALYPWFRIDVLNGFAVVAASLFFVLTVLYSTKFLRKDVARFP